MTEATFDRWDVLEAWYLWLTDNHSGQWSDEYRRLCKMRTYFNPGHELDYYSLSPNAQAIYDGLANV